jgi:hypothetical protein
MTIIVLTQTLFFVPALDLDPKHRLLVRPLCRSFRDFGSPLCINANTA